MSFSSTCRSFRDSRQEISRLSSDCRTFSRTSSRLHQATDTQLPVRGGAEAVMKQQFQHFHVAADGTMSRNERIKLKDVPLKMNHHWQSDVPAEAASLWDKRTDEPEVHPSSDARPQRVGSTQDDHQIWTFYSHSCKLEGRANMVRHQRVWGRRGWTIWSHLQMDIMSISSLTADLLPLPPGVSTKLTSIQNKLTKDIFYVATRVSSKVLWLCSTFQGLTLDSAWKVTIKFDF